MRMTSNSPWKPFMKPISRIKSMWLVTALKRWIIFLAIPKAPNAKPPNCPAYFVGLKSAENQGHGRAAPDQERSPDKKNSGDCSNGFGKELRCSRKPAIRCRYLHRKTRHVRKFQPGYAAIAVAVGVVSPLSAE